MASILLKRPTRGGPKDDYLALILRFPLAPIRNAAQLRLAHKMVDELSDIKEKKLTTGQADYLMVLGDQVSRYEEKYAAAGKRVSGMDLLKHLLEAGELNASDLGRILGQRELGSKILRGDRSISRGHATKLGERFKLPAEIFLR